MSRKKKAPTTTATSLQTLKIGNRVRCTDDRVEGRIVWANGVSVKIKWDDGEQVTWKRDSLAGRPIEFLDAAAEGDQPAAPAASATAELAATTEAPQAGRKVTPATTEPIAAEPASPLPEATEKQTGPSPRRTGGRAAWQAEAAAESTGAAEGQEAERLGRCRQGLGRHRPADELPGDDRRDGSEEILDFAGW